MKVNQLNLLDNLIIGERLILRKPTINDANDLFEYLSSVENTYWIDVVAQKHLSETIDSINNYFLAIPDGKYVIELKESHKVIGAIDIRRHEEYYDIGYVLNSKFHNKGYASEALNILLKNIEEKTDIEQLYILVDKENTPSNCVVIKSDFILHAEVIRHFAKLKQDRIYNQYKWKGKK